MSPVSSSLAPLSLTRPDDVTPAQFNASVVTTIDKIAEALKKYTEANLEEKKDCPLFLALASCNELLAFTRERFVPVECPVEKEKRERSLVIENLPESKKVHASEHVDADYKHVQTILNTMNIKVRPDTVFRMGEKSAPTTDNPNPKPRLLKVLLPRASSQKSVLRQCGTVLSTHSIYSTIQIRPSLTQSERTTAFNLREQKRVLNAKAEKEGKDKNMWVIYAGKFLEKSQVASYRRSLSKNKTQPNTPLTPSSSTAFPFSANGSKSSN